MNTETQTKFIVAIGAAALAAGAIGVTATRSYIRKHRTCKPLPGTTKVERIVIIKTLKK